MRNIAISLITAWMLAAASTEACELCGGLARRNSLAYEFEHADVIVYGRLANPKLLTGAGKGTTDFHVDRILKDDPGFSREKTLTIPHYLPVLDPKSPPKCVMFYRKQDARFDPYWSKEVTALAVFDFVAEINRLRKHPDKMLLHAAKHFDDADPQVADEAFMVFAKSDDKAIAEIAKKLSPVNLRKLVKNPDMESERLSMFAYLLGACGNNDDAELLTSLMKDRSPRMYKAFEGVLAGYVTMRPKEGWAAVEASIKDDKQSFLRRYATLRTLRFFYASKPKETGPQVMHNLGLAIGHPDIADMAIEDLRKWKRWEHTALIVSCWDKKSHDSRITKQSVVRYALACPEPAARAMLERARRQDPEMVKAMEEELK
jgi:hypothetical protein